MLYQRSTGSTVCLHEASAKRNPQQTTQNREADIYQLKFLHETAYVAVLL